MITMLRKEFGLAIHPLYVVSGFIFALFALMPNWVFSIIPLYFCWVTVPILMSQCRTNKDIEFSALLPVSRNSIVGARIISFMVLEMVHVVGVGLVTIVHNAMYPPGNYLLALGTGYLGAIMVVYALFNLALFPMFYGTGRKFGLPLITAIIVAMLATAAIEVANVRFPAVRRLLEGGGITGVAVMLGGLAVFVLFSYLAYVMSARRFRTVQL